MPSHSVIHRSSGVGALSALLNWRSFPYEQSKFLVKGTELAQAIVPDTCSRFAVVEYRTRDADGFPSAAYRLRDAETVSDADIRAGKRPAIVGNFDSLDDAVKAAQEACK